LGSQHSVFLRANRFFLFWQSGCWHQSSEWRAALFFAGVPLFPQTCPAVRGSFFSPVASFAHSLPLRVATRRPGFLWHRIEFFLTVEDPFVRFIHVVRNDCWYQLGGVRKLSFFPPSGFCSFLSVTPHSGFPAPGRIWVWLSGLYAATGQIFLIFLTPSLQTTTTKTNKKQPKKKGVGGGGGGVGWGGFPDRSFLFLFSRPSVDRIPLTVIFQRDSRAQYATFFCLFPLFRLMVNKFLTVS